MMCPVARPTTESTDDLLIHILAIGEHHLQMKTEIPVARHHMRYLLVATHAHNCHMKMHFVVEIDDTTGYLMLCASRRQGYPGLLNEVSASELETMENDLKKALRDRVITFVSLKGEPGKYLDGC